MPASSTLRDTLSALYHGDTPRARRFRYALVAFDIATIGLFLVSSVAREEWWMQPLDLVFAVILGTDFLARLWVETDKRGYLLSLATLADIVVIVSLCFAAFVDNLGFLRIARSLRLLRSYHLLRDLRRDSPFFRRNEEVIRRAVNLIVFIFVITSLVFVTQNDHNPKIATYVDALYFTITTLTTTGFGDITLEGTGGRLISIVIMIIGVSLFIRLLQVIFRPPKVRFQCPDCALYLHDIDAVHCKGCGRVLQIPNEGEV